MLNDNQNLIKLLNNQFNAELYASHVYLALSAWCETKCYNGFAALFKQQFEDEQEHAISIFDFINDLILDNTKAVAEIESIPNPDLVWQTLEDVFTDVLKLETLYTHLISNIVFEANQGGKFIVSSFFKDLLDNQVGEQEEANNWLQRIKNAGGEYCALLQLDNEALCKTKGKV